MPFPISDRVVYEMNPIDKVVCQLRFPPILKIDSETPAIFQDKIRDRFPNYMEKSESIQMFPSHGDVPVSNELMQLYSKTTLLKNHEFSCSDGIYSVNLTRTFISLTATSYENWQVFKEQFQFIVDAFALEYNPAFYVRIGLRYIDVFNRHILSLNGSKWGDLIKPEIIGLIGSNLADNVKSFQNVYEINLNDNAGQLRLLSSLVQHKDTEEQCIMLDSDFYYAKKTRKEDYVKALEELHSKSGNMLRWAIKEPLHNAMKPIKREK